MTTRIKDLPDDAAPAGTDRVAVDGVTTRSVTITNFKTAVSPTMGAGVATFLATPSSANLRGALTDETGTGAAVFGTSPTIASPTFTGANFVALTQLATQAAFTLVGNNTSGAAAPTAVDMALLTAKASPTASDLVMISDQAASGAWKKATVASVSSAGSVASVNGQTGALVQRILPGGRVTVFNGIPIPTSDAAGAVAVYYTPCLHDQISIYDGTNQIPTTFTQLECDLDSNSGHTNYHQSGKNYDFFVINDAGTPRLGTGPKWDDGAVAGSDTARGTGAASTELQVLNGVQTNKNTITIRFGTAAGNTVSVPANRATYVGTGRMTANGAIDDSAAKRFLWNAYNQVERHMNRREVAGTWPYTVATIRQANANAANQLDFVTGLGGCAVEAEVLVSASNTGAISISTGIGLDSTTTVSPDCINPFFSLAAGLVGSPTAFYRGQPGIGHHVLTWLEYSGAAGTTTWFGTLGPATSGINGAVWG